MKAPSKDVSGSLRGQSMPGRGRMNVSTSGLKQYGPSMTVPGEGRTSKAPGATTARDDRQDRNAAIAAEPMSRKLGG